MQQIDESIFLFLNGLHNHFFDVFFWWATDAVNYLPFHIIAILVVTWLAYREFGKKIWMALLFVVLTILFVTLTALLIEQSCELIKHSVCRLRPTHNPDIASLVHVVNDYRGGKYGFPSAHAGNTFGIAMFLYCAMRPQRWTVIFFVWAAIMSYSRIYLGVHYLSDILCGAALGTLIGWGMAAVFRKIRLLSRIT